MVSLENEKSTKKGFSREEERERERGGCLSKGRLVRVCAGVRGWVRACVCELVTVVLNQGETEREDVTI